MTGSSTEPATRRTSTEVTPHALAASCARSTMWSTRSACQREPTMPTVSPSASTVLRCGSPKPAMHGLLPIFPISESLGLGDLAELVEEVTHPVTLGAQVVDVLRVRAHRQHLASHDRQAVPLQPGPLRRIVGEQPHAPYAEVVEDLRAGAVVAGVGRQPQLEVRVDGVEAAVL